MPILWRFRMRLWVLTGKPPVSPRPPSTPGAMTTELTPPFIPIPTGRIIFTGIRRWYRIIIFRLSEERKRYVITCLWAMWKIRVSFIIPIMSVINCVRMSKSTSNPGSLPEWTSSVIWIPIIRMPKMLPTEETWYSVREHWIQFPAWRSMTLKRVCTEVCKIRRKRTSAILILTGVCGFTKRIFR